MELVNKDAKDDPAFEWFENHIQVLNDITFILGIGKGLEQSMEAAEEVGEKNYKLRELSRTRFAAYFGGSISNFEKRMETNVAALRKRTESIDKKVKEKASRLLNQICSKQFLLLNLGILDIYQLLGRISKQLQTVEQFPWNIPKVQQALVQQLKKMEGLKLGGEGDEMEQELDESLWESLGAKMDDVLDQRYMTAQTTVFAPGDLFTVTLV